MARYYIIRRNDDKVGIFSFILTSLSHIKYAEKHHLIPVIDMKNYKNAYLYGDEVGKRNAWEFFFEQPKGIGLDEAYRSDYQLSSGHFCKNEMPSNDFLENKAPKSELCVWERIWKANIRYNESMRKYLEDICIGMDYSGKVLGVLIRGGDYFTYTDENRNQEYKLSEIFECVALMKEISRCDVIYLATDDDRILNLFLSFFGGSRVLYNTREFRIHSSGDYNANLWKKAKIDLRLKGMDYIANIDVLSKCNSIFATKTSASVFLPFLGRYEYSCYYNLIDFSKKKFEKMILKDKNIIF